MTDTVRNSVALEPGFPALHAYLSTAMGPEKKKTLKMTKMWIS